MRLRRRTVLLVFATSVTAIAGCIADEATESGNQSADGEDRSDDEEESTENDGPQPPQSDEEEAPDDPDHPGGQSELGYIRVFIAVDIPDDATILDAKEDSLLDDEYIEAALEYADEEYEPEMEDEFDPEEQGKFGSELVEYPIRGLDEISAARETLGRDNEHSGFQWFVEHTGTKYKIHIQGPPE